MSMSDTLPPLTGTWAAEDRTHSSIVHDSQRAMRVSLEQNLGPEMHKALHIKNIEDTVAMLTPLVNNAVSAALTHDPKSPMPTDESHGKPALPLTEEDQTRFTTALSQMDASAAHAVAGALTAGLQEAFASTERSRANELTRGVRRSADATLQR